MTTHGGGHEIKLPKVIGLTQLVFRSVLLLVILTANAWAVSDTQNLADDQLVVVVNAQNSLSSLSKNDIINIYMGRFNTFPDGSPVSTIDHPPETPEKQAFYQQLVGQSERKIKAYWSRLLFSGRARPPQSSKSEEEIVEFIKSTPNALAYVRRESITPEMKIVYQF